MKNSFFVLEGYVSGKIYRNSAPDHSWTRTTFAVAIKQPGDTLSKYLDVATFEIFDFDVGDRVRVTGYIDVKKSKEGYARICLIADSLYVVKRKQSQYQRINDVIDSVDSILKPDEEEDNIPF